MVLDLLITKVALKAGVAVREETIRPEDLRGLLRFREDFPEAKAHLLYLGNRRWHERGIEVLPFSECVNELDRWL